MNMSITPGVLYVIATPIGNLDDISLRALEVLRQVDLIAAEDTRHSKQLLTHFGIQRSLISLHEHNEQSRTLELVPLLAEGKSIALISDAGTPLISDPGFHLLRSLRARNLQAVPIPGPSSVLAALSVAGLPTDRFVFEGFLPPRAGARRQRLQQLTQEQRTLVFFEASHRLKTCLDDMAAILGTERQAVLARELTKLYEQIHGDTLGSLVSWLDADDNRCKGEFVIVVSGVQPSTLQADAAAQAQPILKVLIAELPLKQAVVIAAKLTNLRKNELYELALQLIKRPH